MRTPIVILTFAALLLGVYATHSEAAGNASPTDRKIAKLQRQVTSLQKQVKQLNRNLNSVNRAVTAGFEGDTCALAQTADLLQGTWLTIDQMAQALQGRTYFGPQQPLDDYRNCADLINPTVPRVGIQSPPTIAPLRPMIQWLHVDL